MEAHDRPRSGARASLVGRPWVWATLPVACLAFLLWSDLASAWLNRWQADYVTAAGEQRVVALPDGSAVTLDTASELRMAYRETERGMLHHVPMHVIDIPVEFGFIADEMFLESLLPQRALVPTGRRPATQRSVGRSSRYGFFTAQGAASEVVGRAENRSRNHRRSIAFS